MYRWSTEEYLYWSTHQAKQRLAQWPESLKKPSAVILAYWVRDAHHWPLKPMSTPSPRRGLFRLPVGSPRGGSPSCQQKAQAITERVSRRLCRQSDRAEATFSSQSIYGLFLSRSRIPDQNMSLRWLNRPPCWTFRTFSTDLFLDADPIHLTADGHQALADALSNQLR